MKRIYPIEKIETFKKVFDENPQEELKDWLKVLPKDFEFHEIRLLSEFLSKIKYTIMKIAISGAGNVGVLSHVLF